MTGKRRTSKRYDEAKENLLEKKRWEREDRAKNYKSKSDEINSSQALKFIRDANKLRDEDLMGPSGGSVELPKAVVGSRQTKRGLHQQAVSVSETLVQSLAAEQEPPAFAEMVLVLFVDRKYQEDLIVNSSEEFERHLKRGYSVKRARRLYWASVLRSLVPQLTTYARRRGRSLAKWLGILGALEEFARHFLR